MRIEPEGGQDIPTECASAIITIGSHKYRVRDRGDYLQFDILDGGMAITLRRPAR